MTNKKQKGEWVLSKMGHLYPKCHLEVETYLYNNKIQVICTALDCGNFIQYDLKEEKTQYCKHEHPLKWYKLKDNTRLCENCHLEIDPRRLK